MNKKGEGFSINNTLDLEALRIELTTGEVIELRGTFQELNIYCNLFSEGVSGNLIFNDTLNVTNNGPILGGEKVFVRWKSPMYSEFSEMLFKVQKVSERVPTANQSTVVRLELLSSDLFDSLAISLSRGFNNQYSKAVKLYWESVDFLKPIFTDESQGIHTFVLPHSRNPIDNINWVANRARTPDGLPFVFFEDLEGFNFASWSKMLSQKSQVKLFHQPQRTLETPEKEFRNIQAVEFGNNSRDASLFSVLGLTGTQEQVYDPLTKSLVVMNKEFKEWVDTAPRLDKGTITNQALPASSVQFLLVKPDNSQSTIFFRDALNYAMQNACMTIMTPGDNRMRVGSIAYVDQISPQIQNGSGLINERFINGNYMVTGLKHTLRPNDYRLYWKLAKESYFKEVKSNG